MYRKTVEELQKDQREKLVIDIRSEQDYIKETYPGAKHIFWEEFMEHIGEIPKELPVYLFCYTGQRSDEIAEDLSEQGYEIYSIEGGYRSASAALSANRSAVPSSSFIKSASFLRR